MRLRRKPHNFYRFILSNESSLRIPTKFTREHRKQILLNNVLLIVSDDKAWPLEWMISSDGNLWLKKGWPEFAEHYDLGLGHLLLFNHLGKSIFHVSIFDPSNCEINYLAPTKSPKSICDSETDLVHAHSTFQEMEVNTYLALKKGKELSIREASRNRPFRLAKSFQSDNPFCSVTMKISYFGNWGLYIPMQFLKRYLTMDENYVNCVLQLLDGRNWGPIKCKEYKGYGKLYGANWKKFRDDNHLSLGDVCVLELINANQKVLKVTIFRAC